jgi:hypothetical protein
MPDSDNVGSALMVDDWDKTGLQRTTGIWLIDINYIQLVAKVQPILL